MMNTIKVNQHIDATVNNSTGIGSIQRLEREYERGGSSQSSTSNKPKKKKSGMPKKGEGFSLYDVRTFSSKRLRLDGEVGFCRNRPS